MARRKEEHDKKHRVRNIQKGHTLKEISHPFFSGKVCPYCLNETILANSKEVYGKSYGLIYLCRECRAWVGVHKGTTVSLGMVANDELRRLKSKAHAVFDKIAKSDLINKLMPKVVYLKNIPIVSNRKRAYIWLSKKMRVPYEYCHIGMFDERQCKMVIGISKKALKKIDQKVDK